MFDPTGSRCLIQLTANRFR